MAKSNPSAKKISLYMINTDVVKAEIKDINKLEITDEIKNQQVVDYLCDCLKIKQYENEDIKSIEDYKLSFMFKKSTTNRKSNNAYFEPILVNKNLFDDSAQDNKAILFIYNESRIYILPVGTAYGDFSPYIDEYFGIKVLGKCITIDQFDVYNQKTQSVAGYEKLSNSSYRNGCSLSTVKKIENVLKEIGGKLNTSAFNDELKEIFTKAKVSVNAKSSISFGNKVSFLNTIEIINWIEDVLDSEKENLILNGMQIIKKKSKLYEQYLSRVTNDLYDLFQQYIQGNLDVNKYDVIHKEPDEYLKADSIEVLYNHNSVTLEDTNSLTCIFDIIDKNITKEDFIKLISQIYIVAYDENKLALTRDTFINHLSGEIPYITGDDGKLIIMDGEIIQLNNHYLTNINTKLKTEIEQRKININLPSWSTSKDETEYIKQFETLGGLIIHPKKPKGIELCDVVIKSNGTYHLLFIKQGFDYNVRDLSSQMKISKQLTNEDNFEEYIEELFNKLKQDEDDGINKNLSLFDKQDFIQAIKNKQCEYVFAVYINGDRELETQEQFNSCIAKISLDELIGEFNRTSHRLKICKIYD